MKEDKNKINIYTMTLGFSENNGYLLKSKIKVESKEKKESLEKLGYKTYRINGVKQ